MNDKKAPESKLDKLNLSDLIPLKEAAKISGLSQGHLSLLLRSGDLWGTKIGGRNWFTTEEVVKEYLAQNPQPGPKTKK